MADVDLFQEDNAASPASEDTTTKNLITPYEIERMIKFSEEKDIDMQRIFTEGYEKDVFCRKKTNVRVNSGEESKVAAMLMRRTGKQFKSTASSEVVEHNCFVALDKTGEHAMFYHGDFVTGTHDDIKNRLRTTISKLNEQLKVESHAPSERYDVMYYTEGCSFSTLKSIF